MKKRVLIVEDDKFFRFAVKKVIDWEKYGFEIAGEAVHGEAALEFLETQSVEVVVTDMSMPVMNGIELTAALKKKYPDILIIALSAYDDFEFVKESLKLGAQDYILKQEMDKQDVGAAVQNAWKQHMESMANDTEMKVRILSYLNGEEKEEGGKKFLELCISNQTGIYLCWIENLNQNWISPSLQKKSWYYGSLFEFHGKKEHLLILPSIKDHSQKNQMEHRDGVLRELECLLEEEEYLGGISCLRTHAEELPLMCLEAKKAGELGKYSGRKRILAWDRVGHVYHSRNLKFMEKQELYNDIHSLEMAENALHALTEKLCREMPSEENIRKNYLFLLNSISTSLGLDIGKLEFADMKEQLDKCKLVRRKSEICEGFLKKMFWSSQQNMMHPSVLQSIRYMRLNYKRDISLGEIADAVGLNETYFSGLFKKDTQTNITEYLNRIRIEKAKELLNQTNYKNYEIAEQIGISNASYFSTIFKKQTGMTIQEYRQLVTKKELGKI